MNGNKMPELRSLPSLDKFGISQLGFLPGQSPCIRLSDSYYEPWESIIARLPLLIESRSIRQPVNAIPVLTTTRLCDESEWRRAFLILSVLAQGYVWAGETPSERLPPAIVVPLLETASHLEMLPTASYAALNLWNWRPLSTDADLTQPENMKSLITFTGTEDESWFFIVSNAMEARAAPLLQEMLTAIAAVGCDDHDTIISSLEFLASELLEIGKLLDRMVERCKPEVFYHQIRPLLAGSLNDNLPRGVFYDEGNGEGSWCKFRGGSNGQSSLVQFFDSVLGISHEETAGFHQEMRSYMPGPHSRFLQNVASQARIREYTLANPSIPGLARAYDEAVASLGKFRDKHIQLVTRYVILPSRAPVMRQASGATSLATCLTRISSISISEVVGTGGTSVLPFLQQSRNETRAAAVMLPIVTTARLTQTCGHASRSAMDTHDSGSSHSIESLA